ncbi:MAG: AbrB/MazE/SpoVT family DNA-binding domain-containing protein [Clostridia bacterium]|nr:AbrB/MazE/SpoVT family DNA-binding domain-containing protein [Clostridia bacterium]
MKATGIVRRIDDLGRVVIPKEIRRTMRIREGAPLEIFTDRDGEVIFKKYSPVGELADIASEYCETLYKSCTLICAVCDMDTIIACSGVPKKELMEKKNSAALDGIVQGRSLYTYSPSREKLYPSDDCRSLYIVCAQPIFAQGDVIGCVMAFEHTDSKDDGGATEAQTKLVQSAAMFLGRQLES